MQFDYILDGLNPRRPPNLITAYTTLSLATLAYEAGQNYVNQLEEIFPGTEVARVGGGAQFVPHVLTVRHNKGTIVAVEGTRNWLQWASYVAGEPWETWPTGPGKVFGPFLRLFNQLRTIWLDIVASNPKVIATGHSLGAVMACFFARLSQDLGQVAKLVHTFGTPRSVDATWVARYRAPTFCLDHPLDQVTLAPLDAIGFLRSPVESLRIFDDYVASGTPWVLPQWVGIGSQWPGVDRGRAFAAAWAAPSLSFHQTFQYLLAMTLAMSEAEREYVEPLETLMRNLGLYQPWPA